MDRLWVHPEHNPTPRLKICAMDLEMLRSHLNVAQMSLQEIDLIYSGASGRGPESQSLLK